MKKWIVIAIIGMLFVVGCKKTEGVYKVGVSKIVAHPALDAVEKGILDQLHNDGFDNVVFDFQNANGEPATANQIANKFKANKVDVAVGIATPTAQALVSILENTPIVFAAVTDPQAAGLVEDSTVGDEKVTGVSDMTPVETQIEMFIKLKNIKRLGTVYSSNESNSIVVAELLRKICAAKGLELIESTVTNSAEVRQATQSIVKRIDGMYISTDNTVVSALSSVVDVCNSNNIPILSADPSSAIDNPVLLSYGVNYYQIGLRTGKIVGNF